MRLYCAPGTISVATAITLHEAGLDFDQIRVDFKSAEQTKVDYLARNPKGRVPTLEVDGHHLTATGTGAIDGLHPLRGNLAPSAGGSAQINDAQSGFQEAMLVVDFL